MSFKKFVFEWEERDGVARGTNISLKSSFVMVRRFQYNGKGR